MRNLNSTSSRPPAGGVVVAVLLAFALAVPAAAVVQLDPVGESGIVLASHPDGGYLVVWRDPGSGRLTARPVSPIGLPGATISTGVTTSVSTGRDLAAAVSPSGDWVLIVRTAPDVLAGFLLSPAGAVLAELDLTVPDATRYRSPAVATVPGGGYVAAWAVAHPDDVVPGDPPIPELREVDAWAARFDPEGARVAGPVRVNEERLHSQDPSAVGAGPETVVVVWEGYTGEGELGEGRLRVLGHDLSPRTGERRVNPTRLSLANQYGFRLGMGGDGRFVVAWTSGEGELDGSERGPAPDAVRLQAFSAEGDRVGTDPLVNVNTAGFQGDPAVGVDADGVAWVVWEDGGVLPVTGDRERPPRVMARPFTLDGLPLAGELRVTDRTSPRHLRAAGGASGVLAAWTDLTFLYAAVIDDGFQQEPPPDDRALASPELSDFRVWVRIAAGDSSLWGTEEPVCLAETLCASGAVPGRTEVLVRIVGPKPNGFLWPTIVKLSTSPIEVWIEQVSTGEVQFYLLPGASPGSDVLPGLFDRRGFRP